MGCALELGNAIQMSGLLRRPVDLPLDAAAFDQFLVDMKAQYGGRKTLTTDPNVASDMVASFSKP